MKIIKSLKFYGLLFLIGFWSGSQAALLAGCDKDYIAKMKFALTYAGSSLTADDLDKKAENFCPHAFIVNHSPSTESGSDNYVLRFDFEQSGPEDDVETSVLKKVTAALKKKGFTAKPSFTASTGDEQNMLLWRGPSNTWVRVYWYNREAAENKTLFELRIGNTHS